MTTWVETPRGGRDRGPVGVARAWIEVLVRPRRFFSNGVAPGDQAPGLTFAVVVSLCYVGGLIAAQPGRVFAEERIPILADSVALTTLLVLLLTAVIVAPAALHLAAAIQTVLLMVLVEDRAGVSETVQVLGYATAPCAVAWLPYPALTALCAAYGAGLLVVGLAVVHETTPGRALLAAIVPAALVFGVAFGGIAAGTALAGAFAG